MFADGGSSAKTLLVADGNCQKVLKYATWEGIGSSGVPWLRAQSARLQELRGFLPSDCSLVVPEVFEEYMGDSFFYYTSEYFHGSEALSVYFFKHPQEARVAYLTEINQLITGMVGYFYAAGRLPVPEGYIGKVHLNKITYRLSYLTQRTGLFWDEYLHGTSLPRMFKELLTAGTIHVNGREYCNAPRLVAALQNNPHTTASLTPVFLPEYAHGDSTLRNYLFLADKTIALIDVRGNTLPGNAPSRICVPYELGKMLRTFYLEIVRQNAFQVSGGASSFALEFDVGNPAVAAFLEVREQLINALPTNSALAALLADEPDWLRKTLFAEACHFLADAANRLESDRSGRQTLAYYLIGTILLNDIVDA